MENVYSTSHNIPRRVYTFLVVSRSFLDVLCFVGTVLRSFTLDILSCGRDVDEDNSRRVQDETLYLAELVAGK